MSTQSRQIFVNLPVGDLDGSKAFFGALGFGFDERFTDDSAACMVVGDQAYVMLLEQQRFAEFTSRPVADARTVTEAILAVSADRREGVDELADAALAAGGVPASDPTDEGFMYARSFHDLDGHLWEVVWMDPKVLEQGPAHMAESA